MSRPKLAQEHKRDIKLNVYLTQMEEQMVKELAKEMHVPVALIVRMALLEYYGRVKSNGRD